MSQKHRHQWGPWRHVYGTRRRFNWWVRFCVEGSCNEKQDRYKRPQCAAQDAQRGRGEDVIEAKHLTASAGVIPHTIVQAINSSKRPDGLIDFDVLSVQLIAALIDANSLRRRPPRAGKQGER